MKLKRIVFVVVALGVVFTANATFAQSSGYQAPPIEIKADEKEPDRRMQHGFRMGYSYIMNADVSSTLTGQSLLEELDLRSPHLFTLGYEVFYRLVGHSWLNVLLVGNIMISGLEQSRFLPTGNFLMGFEFEENFQLGVGINLAPTFQKASHMVIAGGWTPKVGSFYVPVHVHFIPDVDGHHRTGVTIGVTW